MNIRNGLHVLSILSKRTTMKSRMYEYVTDLETVKL